MSEWLKVEHYYDKDAFYGGDFQTTWIRADTVLSMDVLDDGDTLIVNFVGDNPTSTAMTKIKSARFVNTDEDKPDNYFVTRSCGGCE